MTVRIMPTLNPLISLLQFKENLKKYLLKIKEIKIIPVIQIPIMGCILIDKAEKKPAKNKFPENNNPKIKVTIARLSIP